MTTTLPTVLTLEAFLKLPETKPATEFIKGNISQKPMPQGKHARLQLKFCNTINLVAETAQIALAFPELHCTFGGRSIVPDATVFTWDRLALDANREIANTFAIAPDWTVEILSPDQKATKVISNILHCLKYGTQLGWLIDPEERLILVFMPGQEPIELTGSDTLPLPQFLTSGLSPANSPGQEANNSLNNLTVDQVFGWLRVGS
jgi:Uma2 family endonuclease